MTKASTVPQVADKIPRMKVLRSASDVADNSKNTKCKFCNVKLLSETKCEAILENDALNNAKYGRKTGHISTSIATVSITQRQAPSRTIRGSLFLPPTTE